MYKFDRKIRLGTKQDGGYVIGDIGNVYDCYISAGVGNEESFSRDILNKYKFDHCYAFDGTINRYPVKYTDKISFIKKNINSFGDENNTNLSYLTKEHDNIFLKMDIEGKEYTWIPSIDLLCFKQIVIEFHNINKWNEKKNECLRKLFQSHYIVHAHGNNYSGITNNIPNTLELTYIRKDQFDEKPKLNNIPLPINNLDFPNNPLKKDISLNCDPFVYKIPML